MAIISLQTKRVTIVPFEKKHITDEYLSWLNDKSIMRYSEQRHKRHTKANCENYLASFVDSPNYFWSIFDLQNADELIGTMTSYVDVHNNIADIGIMLGSKKHRGTGMAFDAWSRVIKWLLNEKGIRKVTAGTLSVNQPMLAIMRKSGMTEDGVRKDHYVNNGITVDVVYMAVFSKPGVNYG